MIIGVVPSIQEKYKDQFEYSCDVRLIFFLKEIFKKSKIELLTLNHKINKKFKLIVISGASGNDLIMFDKSKKNLIRNKLDQKFFNQALKFKIPLIGICHGAQFIAKKYDSRLKNKKHVGKHQIKILKKNNEFSVNSFHNKVITKLGKNLEIQAEAKDKTIELFIHKNQKICGLMWHPERNKKFTNFDKKIFKNLCI